MPPVEDGDKYYIRKEYAEVSKLDKVNSSAGGREGPLGDTEQKEGDNGDHTGDS